MVNFVISPTSPISSAVATNSAGLITGAPGESQRSSASWAITCPLDSDHSGWKSRRIAPSRTTWRTNEWVSRRRVNSVATRSSKVTERLRPSSLA